MDARERFSENKLIRDFDAITKSPGSVRLHGKEHEIRPVTVGEWFAFAHAIQEVSSLEKREKVTLDEIVSAYFGIIQPYLPSITRQDIRDCSQAQVSALVDMITCHVTGKLTDEKKKSLMGQPN